MSESKPLCRSCTKCMQVKLLTEFHKDKSQSLGVHPVCKPCKRAAVKALRVKDPEATRAAQRKYRADNLEKIQNRERQRRELNRDLIAAQKKAWRLANPDRNPERTRKLKRAYYESHREQYREHGRRWRAANPEAARASVRKSMAKNPSLRTEANQRRRARIAGTAIGEIDYQALWTGFCAMCTEPLTRGIKFPEPQSPSIDHIVPLSRGGTHTQDNLRWTCLSCNCRKGVSAA